MPRIPLLPLIFPVLVLLALPAARLPAQPTTPYQATLPIGREWIEASTRTEVPFGLKSGISQQVWDALYTPGYGSSVLYAGFSVRRDASGAVCGAFWVECEVAFSSTNYTSAQMSNTFISNRGNDYTPVINRMRLSFPATTATARPNDFLIPFPFAQPFIFQRYQSAGLMMETMVFSASSSSPGSSFTIDALGPASSITPPQGRSAPGCRATVTGKPLDCTLALGGVGGSQLNITVKETTVYSPVLLFLGRSSSRWGTIPLPLDLGPLGAPGCFVYVDYLVPLTGKADGQGTWQTSLAIPSSVPTAYPVYGQAYVPAIGMNYLGIAASNGAAVLSMGIAPTAWLYDTNSPVAISGTVRQYNGPVIALNYL